MPMSANQESLASEWIELHLGNDRKCAICGTSALALSKEIVSAPALYAGNAEVGPSHVPFFLLECAKCGHAHFFNAVTAGVVKLR